MDANQLIKEAEDAVRSACRLCQEVCEEQCGPQAIEKKDKSPVTIADFGAQAVISDLLGVAFPHLPLIAEENADDLRRAEQAGVKRRMLQYVQNILPHRNEHEILQVIDRGNYEGGPTGTYWTLDPIDGTKGFLRGQQYAVALALIQEGEVVLSVLGCPNLPLDGTNPSSLVGCLFTAVRGDGATMQALTTENCSSAIQVTPVAKAIDATFCESVESGHTSHDHAQQIAERLGVTKPPFRIDSQCKYAAIARGDASIYLRLPTRADYEEKIWDHAAGYLVVCEAGGRVTDTRGLSLDFSRGRTLKNNTGVVATNGHIHSEVIDAVQSVLYS